MKNKLFIIIVFLIGFGAIMSCERENYNKFNNNNIVTKDNNKNTLDPEYIGNMHNELLNRYYEEFIQNQNTADSIILDINELLSFFYEQPEVESLNENVKYEITAFFNSFQSSGDGDETFNQFSIFLENSVGEIYEASYIDIVEGNITGSITQELIDVHESIKVSSELYWGQHNNTKVCFSCADAAGGAWGFFFGGVGSFVAGATASIIAKKINAYDGPTYVFDGKIHTPKDI
ncbi:MAG TPA: hypothetical protein ENN45_01620 [Bacteroidetes bacterium]|nr:hypothetical protein [Bacteroidota bacterium]